MRLISWNINGVRAVHKRGELDWAFTTEDADVVCLQETKVSAEDLPRSLSHPEGWKSLYNPAERKGYSGVATYLREDLAPAAWAPGLGLDRFDGEGRVIRCDLDAFVLYNIYFPNGGRGPERLAFKLDFYDAVFDQLTALVDQGREVVLCGDVNCAHRDIDIHDPARFAGHTGFSQKERAFVDRLLDAGFVDSFRAEHGDLERQFTWWDNYRNYRPKNDGWRIDYFFITEGLEEVMVDAWISPHIMGSDHCPIGLELDIDL